MMIIYLHIPKTGGTSFMSNVSVIPSKNGYEFGESVVSLLQDGRKIAPTTNVLCGHFPYGIHKVFHLEDYQYFTFMREPISRWISSINHCINLGGSVLTDKYKTGGVKSVLRYCQKYRVDADIQTRQLSGLENLNHIYCYKDKSKEVIKYKNHYNGNLYIPHNCFRHSVMSQDEENQMLRAAICNIKNFRFIGFQDCFPRDFERACSIFGWPITTFSKKIRVGKGGPFRLDNEKVRKLATELNQLDIQLFKQAKEIAQ